MAFREVRVFEVREVLRLWQGGESLRAVERLVGLDRKTVRRYVESAVAFGLVRGGPDELGDELMAQVIEAVRPHRVNGHGEAWRLLQAHHDQIKAWVDADLTAVKIHDLCAARASPCLGGRCSATCWRCAGLAIHLDGQLNSCAPVVPFSGGAQRHYD